jgi:outer membrane protein insertion porin family
VVVVFCATVFVAGSLSAQEVRRVIFEQEGYQFPVNTLQYNVKLKKGAKFTRDALDLDVKRLYEMGYFLQVAADTEKAPDGRVDVVFKTKSKQRIRDILIRGNQKFKDTTLRERITLEPGMPLNDKKLKDSIAGLRDFYDDKGYYETTITPDAKSVGNGEVDLIFNIKERLRLRVNSVDFVGNTVYGNYKLKNTIQTQHSYLSWLLNMGLYNLEEMEQDKVRLRNLYWEVGYLDFRVTKVEATPLKDDPEYVNVTFYLDEGKPYEVSDVTISGNSVFKTDELRPLIEMEKGDPYNYKIQQADIKRISEKYYPLGYADFNCEVKRTPNASNHTVKLDYAIHEGIIYTVRDIPISGNHVTKDKVIRRELPIQPNWPLDMALVEAAKARIMGMGYFEKVTITTVDTPKPGEKDILIKVEEKKTARFTIGAGFSDTQSFSGTIELALDNFDLFDPANYFMGGGQRLLLRATLGFEYNEFLISFTEPWLFDIPLKLKVEGYYHNRYYENWDEEHAGGSISLTKKFFDDFTYATLSQRMEYVRVYDMDNDRNSKYFRGEEGSDFLNTSTLILARDTRNNKLDPKSGYLLKLTGAINAGTKCYYRTEFLAQNYYSFFYDWFTIYTGVKYGSVGRISGDSESDMVPIYERYFLGGGNTIRGFPYREVGPEDDQEHVYGGQSMLLSSVEVSHPIWRFIRGAAFVDAGGSWHDSWDLDFSAFNMGAGYGLRLKLPQFPAPIKLDLAYPVVNNQDGVGNKLRFSFSMGFAW